MDERHTKLLKDCKVMLRSTLLPEKDGIAVFRMAKFYEELVMSPFPHREFGFSSAEEFILQHMRDVARVKLNKNGERVFVAVADETTAHIANLVSKQKGRKKKPGKKPFFRPLAHRPNLSASSRGYSSSFHRGPVATQPPSSGAHHPIVKANSSWHLPGSQPPRSTHAFSSARATYPSSSVTHVSKPRELLTLVTQRPEASRTGLRPPSGASAARNAWTSSEAYGNKMLTSELRKTARQAPEPSGALSRLFLQVTSTVNRTEGSGKSEWGPRKVRVTSTVDRTEGSGKSELGPPNINRPLKVQELQPYRPPTPPEFESTVHGYESLQDTQEDLRSMLERIRLKAEQTVARSSVTSKEGAGDARVALGNKKSLKEWLCEMLADKPAGLWSSHIEEQYRIVFGSDLPLSFDALAEQYSDIIYVERFGARFIVYRSSKHFQPVYEEKRLSNGVSESSSVSVQSIPKTNLFNQPTVLPVTSWMEPEKLTLPEISPFLVYVCQAITPAALTVRIIGDDYSVRLEQLEEKLGSFAGYSILRLPEEKMICVALIEAEMEDGTTDISYLRAKIVDVQDDMATVELLDHNGTETISVKSLFIPPPCFPSVPYQAIKCSLTGLEDVNIATELVYSVLESAVLGKTCYATIDKRSPSISLTLLDVENQSGVSVNNELIRSTIFSPQVPQVGDGRDCGVSFVSSSGTVFLQFSGLGLDRLLRLEQCLSDDIFTEDKQVTPKKVEVGSLYTVRASSSKEWTRALVLEHSPSNMVRVQFIDYGDTDDVNVSDVKELPLRDLSLLPYQAVPCVLADLPPVGAAWTEAAAICAMDLVPLSEATAANVLVYSAATDLAPMKVAIFIDNTRSLAKKLGDQLDIWDWSELNSQISVQAADIQSGEDVYITWIDDPSNFRFIPVRFRDELKSLEESMQTFFNSENSSDRLAVTEVVVGELYAVLVSGQWHRAVAKPFPSKSMLASSILVKLVDVGFCRAVDLSCVRKLPSPFRRLPLLAIGARLGNVKPIESVWPESTRTAFSTMMLNQIYTAYVIPETWDSTGLNAPDSLDHIRPVILVGQTTDGGFVFVHTQLVKKGLAEKIIT